MQRKPVKSSNIKSVGYEDHVLEIEFNSGGIYKYLEVGPTVYEEFLKSSSLGKYFHKFIKGNFTCEKVEAKAYPSGKTLKDWNNLTEGYLLTEDGDAGVSFKALRAEARKWYDIYSFDDEKVSMKEPRDAIKAWIKYFFNLI